MVKWVSVGSKQCQKCKEPEAVVSCQICKEPWYLDQLPHGARVFSDTSPSQRWWMLLLLTGQVWWRRRKMGPPWPCSGQSCSRYSMSRTCGPRDMISLLSLRIEDNTHLHLATCRSKIYQEIIIKFVTEAHATFSLQFCYLFTAILLPFH